jgi:hypothetical protein
VHTEKGLSWGESGRHYRRLVPKAGPLERLPLGSLSGEEAYMAKQPCNHPQPQSFSQPHLPTSSNQPSKFQVAAPAHGQIAGVRSCSPPKGILETQPRSLEDTKEPHGCWGRKPEPDTSGRKPRQELLSQPHARLDVSLENTRDMTGQFNRRQPKPEATKSRQNLSATTTYPRMRFFSLLLQPSTQHESCENQMRSLSDMTQGVIGHRGQRNSG